MSVKPKKKGHSHRGYHDSESLRVVNSLRGVHFGEKLKGSLLKGSFDKRVRIDLPVPLPVPTPPPHPPHPPFPSFSTHPNPSPNPSPRDTNRNSHPFAKTTPSKTTPWFLPEHLLLVVFLVRPGSLGCASQQEPCLVPLQYPKGTSRKACLENPDMRTSRCVTERDRDYERQNVRQIRHLDPLVTTRQKIATKHCRITYYKARNYYTNNSETILLCNRCVCNWKINSKRILLCNWHLQKVPHGGALITQNNSCQKALCNRCPV